MIFTGLVNTNFRLYIPILLKDSSYFSGLRGPVTLYTFPSVRALKEVAAINAEFYFSPPLQQLQLSRNDFVACSGVLHRAMFSENCLATPLREITLSHFLGQVSAIMNNNKRKLQSANHRRLADKSALCRRYYGNGFSR